MPEQSRLERRRSRRKASRLVKFAVALAVLTVVVLVAKAASRPDGRVAPVKRVAKPRSEPRSKPKVRSFIILVVSGTTPKSPLVKAVLVAVDIAGGKVHGLALPGSAFMDVPGRGALPLAQAYDEGPSYAVEAVQALTAVVDTSGYLVLSDEAYSRGLKNNKAATLFAKSLASDMSPRGIIDLEDSLSKAKKTEFSDITINARELTIGAERYFELDEVSLRREVRAIWGRDPAPKPARTRVLVLNGCGTPGIGAKAGDLLMGADLKIVDVRNAENFGYKSTLVYAYGDKTVAAAEQVASLLKVGSVKTRPADQDITDIVVVLGADFSP